jgi:RNA polymerase sigma factor (sigma-70 family)
VRGVLHNRWLRPDCCSHFTVSLVPQKTDPTTCSALSSEWFRDEVHRHEPSLRSYLHGAFPAVRDVDDVVQESFLRIWRARASQPIRSARGFLFQVARRLAIDLVRRDRVSPVDRGTDLATIEVADEAVDAASALSTQEKIRLLADALEDLPAKCREVVVLRKIQFLSQRETAERLGLSERTVESQLARGIRRCEQYLRRRGLGASQ